jgi:predicted nucleic acid-binding protein
MVGRLMYLVDTNIWLELLLEQERANEVKQFLSSIEARAIAITDFTIYSIGIILTKLGKKEIFLDFINDILEDSSTLKISLSNAELKELISISGTYRLDFDVSYQYLAAHQNNLSIISFDHDFKRTDRGCLTPREAVNNFPPGR